MLLLLKIPAWALHEVLEFAESSARRPCHATARLCSLNRAMRRVMLGEVVLRDVRSLAEDDAVFAKYGNGTGPRVLDVALAENHWADLKRVSTERLVFARLEHAFVRGSLAPLRNARHLTRLSLAGCELIVSDLEPIAELSRLRHLNLHGCDKLYGDLRPLARLQRLEHLYLDWCNLRGSIAPLAALRHLQVLSIDWCSQLSGNLAETFCPSYVTARDARRRPFDAAIAAADVPPWEPDDDSPPLRRVSVFRAFRISGLHDFVCARPHCRLDR